MDLILVISAAPGSTVLSGATIDGLDPIMRFYSRNEDWRPRWLAPCEAWEAAFTFDGCEDGADGLEGDGLDGSDEAGSSEGISCFLIDIGNALADLPLDINLLRGAACAPDRPSERRKRLLIADMDSTIINQECIDEIADFAGVKAHVSQITERAMRGELDFDAALRERVGLLKDLGEEKLRQVFEERLSLMPGARTLVQTMRADGAFCALVSGGFTYFTSRIATKVGFHVNQANTLNIEGGKLTGTVATPILGRQAKLKALQRYISERRLKPAQTLAVGDGANDLDMIKASGLGVAYRAKPIVAAEAHCSITHGDLTALLYLQGYRRDEFEPD